MSDKAYTVIGTNVVIDCGTVEEAIAYERELWANQPYAPATPAPLDGQTLVLGHPIEDVIAWKAFWDQQRPRDPAPGWVLKLCTFRNCGNNHYHAEQIKREEK